MEKLIDKLPSPTYKSMWSADNRSSWKLPIIPLQLISDYWLIPKRYEIVKQDDRPVHCCLASSGDY